MEATEYYQSRKSSSEKTIKFYEERREKNLVRSKLYLYF